MKKKYEKLIVTPLGPVSESSLLEGSMVTVSPSVQATGQETIEHDFSDDSFNQTWGDLL